MTMHGDKIKQVVAGKDRPAASHRTASTCKFLWSHRRRGKTAGQSQLDASRFTMDAQSQRVTRDTLRSAGKHAVQDKNLFKKVVTIFVGHQAIVLHTAGWSRKQNPPWSRTMREYSRAIRNKQL